MSVLRSIEVKEQFVSVVEAGGWGRSTKMDVMNPVWTYNDRGYYSIAFVGMSQAVQSVF